MGVLVKRVLWVFALGAEGNALSADTQANIDKANQQLRTHNSAHYDYVLCAGGICNARSGQTEPIAFLMRDALTQAAMPQWCIITVTSSHTTRSDVVDSIATLRERFELFPRDIEFTVISERWHLKGIAILLDQLAWPAQVQYVPSDFRLSWRGVLGRIVRLGLYRIDPKGVGKLSRWVEQKRSH